MVPPPRCSLSSRLKVVGGHRIGRFTGILLLFLGIVCFPKVADGENKVPVIDITDLYHPHQDLGDNLDLITAFALSSVDLKAVILDVTDRFRSPKAYSKDGRLLDDSGPRDPGFIPVIQLNYLFNRSIPFGVGPFSEMRSPDDKMELLPGFQESGIHLMKSILESAEEPVDIVSFGSLRPLAVAFNRYPRLFLEKVRRVHICAGATSPEFVEWNVELDSNAMVCILNSGLPIALYPCATDSPFHYGPHNTFWRLQNLNFVRDMDPPLQRYIAYAFSRSTRVDFLRAMEENVSLEVLDAITSQHHNVWETAVWMEVAGLKLVQNSQGHFRLVPHTLVRDSDRILPGSLKPCRLMVQENGCFSFELIDSGTRTLIYDRGDPKENERALREALPALFQSFRSHRE